ncbi:BRO-N domain-containing protein [Ferribacterium limneticum]|uniref:hypothetical protein n=1 Tax=Ferribacterium limneticum TaxID=76259 RepID=UPI001CF89B6A|nr:hypothetical protein [Ferribacterium limneticum]UCV26774.1 hypothetical protein KI617_10675 [Ferribacterium limneticum]UCV30691.1 hypothetical protein KI608_10675 [Ferribacterium limneticum]
MFSLDSVPFSRLEGDSLVNSNLSKLSDLDFLEAFRSRWLTTAQLAKELGYSHVQSVHSIYNSNTELFPDALSTFADVPTSGGTQRTRVYSLKGCYLLAMLATTPAAVKFRAAVLELIEQQHLNYIQRQLEADRTRAAIQLQLQNEEQAHVDTKIETSQRLAEADRLRIEALEAYVSSKLAHLQLAVVDRGSIPVQFKQAQQPRTKEEVRVINLLMEHPGLCIAEVIRRLPDLGFEAVRKVVGRMRKDGLLEAIQLCDADYVVSHPKDKTAFYWVFSTFPRVRFSDSAQGFRM